MNGPNEPSAVEPVPVQLTRMEGTINLIAYQMTEVRAEVKELSLRVTQVELAQATSTGAGAFLKAWLPLIVSVLGVAGLYGFGIKFGG